MPDLLTALTVLPWLIPGGLFTVIFFEWSARDRGAQETLRRVGLKDSDD